MNVTPSPAKTKDLLKQVQVFASSPARGEETVLAEVLIPFNRQTLHPRGDGFSGCRPRPAAFKVPTHERCPISNAAARIANLELKLEEMTEPWRCSSKAPAWWRKPSKPRWPCCSSFKWVSVLSSMMFWRAASATGSRPPSRDFPENPQRGVRRARLFRRDIKYAFLSFCRAQANDISCTFLTDDERQYKQLTEARLPCLP